MDTIIHHEPATDALHALRLFVEGHREGLWHAARLLGGYDGAALVEDLAARLRDDDGIRLSTLRCAHAVHALLTLRNVGDPGRVESGFFAVIDPADPVVEDICLLADGLDDALRASRPARFQAAA